MPLLSGNHCYLLYYYLDCVYIWFSFNEHTKRNTEHTKRNTEHTKRNTEHTKRNTEHTKRNTEHTKRNTEHDRLQVHSCIKTDWQDKMLLSSLQSCVDTVAAIDAGTCYWIIL